jgi:Glycosyl hydrolase catalytic core
VAKERTLVRRGTRALGAALALAAILLCAAASTAFAVPARFWGAVPQASPNLEQLQRLKRGGVDSVRIPIGWESAQPVRNGPFDWADADSRIEAITSAGIEVLPFLSGAPTWAVPRAWVPGSHHGIKAVSRLPATGTAAAGWSGFVRAAVERYGPGGSFWTERPTLPQRPIRTWQIWNEENFKYFVTKPNPAEYGKLVKLSSAAVKGVDSGAQIVLGGLFAKPNEARFKLKPPQAYFAADFLDQLYRTTPGIKSKFDGVALHPYTADYRQLTPDIEEFRAVLERHHDAGKGLWITELGWSSEPPSITDSFAKGPAGQVKQLKGAFRLLARNQAAWRLKRVYWFAITDYFGVCNFCGGSGLFTADFAAKKSWFAYVRFAGGNPN